MSDRLPEVLKELQNIPRWCVWELRARKDDEVAKVPLNPKTGAGAKVNEPSTWGSYEQAYSMAITNARKQGLQIGMNHGIGFLLGEGYAGIDIDDCVDSRGNVSDMAGKIIKAMDSYTEYSPSGKGIHILFKVNDVFSFDGNKGKRKGALEMYCGLRYLTVTGNVYGTEKPIENRSEVALKIYREYFPEKPKESAKNGAINSSQTVNSYSFMGYETDNELLHRMFNSREGQKIQALYNGDILGYESPSEADMALTNYLVYWTGHDASRADRLFRQSGLYRPKWDERHGAQTYGEITIMKAMNDTPRYEPKIEKVSRNYSSDTRANNEGSETKSAPQVETEDDTALSYLEKSFYSDIERVSQFRNRCTGFSNLDKANVRLYPGLYVIGAVSSLGKTTFCSQMADNLASRGEHVIYFSLEQSRLELVSKSLARLTAIQDFENAVSSIGIRAGNINETVKRAIEAYKKIAGNVRVIECNFEITIDAIRDKVLHFMKAHEGVKPVIFVDYLQLVRNANAKLTTKDAVDENVRAFKKLSVDNDLVIFLISSLNRQNYLNVVDFESFKESGGIEYSADVVWGLQLAVMNAGVFNSNTDLQIKRGFVREAKNAVPRLIELVGLKNRYGKSFSRHFFNYYAENDWFQAVDIDAESLDVQISQEYESFKSAYDTGEKRKSKRPKEVD